MTTKTITLYKLLDHKTCISYAEEGPIKLHTLVGSVYVRKSVFVADRPIHDLYPSTIKLILEV